MSIHIGTSGWSYNHWKGGGYPEQVLTDIVTENAGYLRLHGRRAWYKDNYNNEELSSVAETAKKMQHHGAKEVYIFFNNDYAAYAPHNASALARLLRSAVCQTHADG
jgi:uncharacterized protein YecE (DUF72 family)